MYATFMMIAFMASLGLPGLVGFWGEFPLVYGFYEFIQANDMLWLILFCLLTPLISDDYYFGGSAEQPFAAIMAGEPVLPFGPGAFSDIFRLAAQMYATWDGRFASCPGTGGEGSRPV